MKAFVLAAGLGTRLRPLTDHIPKPLIPILNVPSLFYTLSLLKQAGIREIICNVHYQSDAVQEFITSSHLSGLDISFSQEPVILGTGGGLKKCEKLLDKDDFLLVNSDIISDINFQALILHHQKSGLNGTLTLYETPEAATIGCVGVENNRVKDFNNRRHTGLFSSFIYTGTAILSPEIFRFLAAEYSGIVDTGFTGLIDNGGLGYYEHKGLWMDIGTINKYLEANLNPEIILSALAAGMESAIGMRPHSISPEASISTDAGIYRSVIGKGCRIGSHCTIRNSVLLPGTEIKAGSIICNAVVDPFSTTKTDDVQPNEIQ